MVDIMYADLTEEKQQEIANALGYMTPEECSRDRNWSVFPLITLEFDEDECDETDDDEEMCDESDMEFIDPDQEEINDDDRNIPDIDDFIPSE
jgi:hypothetical protein